MTNRRFTRRPLADDARAALFLLAWMTGLVLFCAVCGLLVGETVVAVGVAALALFPAALAAGVWHTATRVR